MSKNQSNVQSCFVGGPIVSANVTTSALNSTFIANTGEIGIFTPDGRRMTEALAATEKQFVIAQARGAAGEPKLLVSEVIDKAKIKSIKSKLYAVAAQQVDYIGYNGTSGSIEVNANELYYIELYLEEYITSSHDGRYIKHGQFNSNSSSTEANIVNGLRLSLVNNFSREPKQLIKFEVVSSAASSAIGAAADTVVGNIGSKYVTVTDVGGNTTVNAIAAGTYFRAGTAVTSPVYLVTASTVGTGGGVLTLDAPLQASVSLVGNTAEFITAVAAAAGTFGLKLTGVAQPWSLEKKFDKVVRWTANLSDDAFGATVITKSVGASEGTGTYKQVAELERFCQRNSNDHYRIGQPNLFDPRQDAAQLTAAQGVGYDVIQIVYEQEEVVGFVGNISPKIFTIATPAADGGVATVNGYNATATGNDITDVLEVLAFGATTGNPLDLG
jgi:hypothetical protein